MKKTILAIAAVCLSLTACTSKSADKTAETEATVAEQAAPAEEVADAVVVLADDEAYTPQTKVEQVTVLDFNAVWCPPCKQFKPAFHSVAAKYPDVKFVSVDVDNNPKTSEAFGIQSIPTVVIMTPDGEPVFYGGTDQLLPESKFDEIVKNVVAGK